MLTSSVIPLPANLTIDGTTLTVAAGAFSAPTQAAADALAQAYVTNFFNAGIADGSLMCGPRQENEPFSMSFLEGAMVIAPYTDTAPISVALNSGQYTQVIIIGGAFEEPLDYIVPEGGGFGLGLQSGSYAPVTVFISEDDDRTLAIGLNSGSYVMVINSSSSNETDTISMSLSDGAYVLVAILGGSPTETVTQSNGFLSGAHTPA